jgi:hypothetical protein
MIEVQKSTDLRNWTRISELQATSTATEVSLPTSLRGEFVRALVIN